MRAPALPLSLVSAPIWHDQAFQAAPEPARGIERHDWAPGSRDCERAQITRPWGNGLSKRAWWGWPGDLLCVNGLGVRTACWLSSQVPVSRRRAAVGQAGAPAAVAPVRARAR